MFGARRVDVAHHLELRGAGDVELERRIVLVERFEPNSPHQSLLFHEQHLSFPAEASSELLANRAGHDVRRDPEAAHSHDEVPVDVHEPLAAPVGVAGILVDAVAIRRHFHPESIEPEHLLAERPVMRVEVRQHDDRVDRVVVRVLDLLERIVRSEPLNVEAHWHRHKVTREERLNVGVEAVAAGPRLHVLLDVSAVEAEAGKVVLERKPFLSEHVSHRSIRRRRTALLEAAPLRSDQRPVRDLGVEHVVETHLGTEIPLSLATDHRERAQPVQLLVGRLGSRDRLVHRRCTFPFGPKSLFSISKCALAPTFASQISY